MLNAFAPPCLSTIVRWHGTMAMIIIPLSIDLVFGLLLRRLLRNGLWSALGFLLVPLSIAVIMSGGPAYLFRDGGEAHGWAVMAFLVFTIFGYPTYLLGLLVGQMLRKKSAAR
jgi:hypothetical protein